jgi:hypothetical protein
MSSKQDNFILSLVRERWTSLGFASEGEAMRQMSETLAQMGNDWKPKSALIERLKATEADPDPPMRELLKTYRTARTNDSSGECETCGHEVAARAGFFFGPHDTGRKWRVHHQSNQCSTEPAPTKIEITEPGIYLTPDDDMIQIYTTNNNRLGGKVWDGSDFKYQRGALQRAGFGTLMAPEAVAARTCMDKYGALPGSEKLRQLAVRYGHNHGNCIFCSRDLTDERSNPNAGGVGYGPTCAKRYNLPWGERAVPALTS